MAQVFGGGQAPTDGAGAQGHPVQSAQQRRGGGLRHAGRGIYIISAYFDKI